MNVDNIEEILGSGTDWEEATATIHYTTHTDEDPLGRENAVLADSPLAECLLGDRPPTDAHRLPNEMVVSS